MAKRQSLMAVLIKAYVDRKNAREQADKAAQAGADRIALEQLRQRAAADKERQRKEAAAERASKREHKEVVEVAAVQRRQAERLERERRLRREQEEKERQRTTMERRLASANARTAEVGARLAELEVLLKARRRDLRSRARSVDEVFNADGPRSMSEVVWRLLAASKLPKGFPATIGAAYRAENSELLLERELPGRTIIPMATGYKYVKSRDTIEPVQRQEAEIRKLYKLVIARLALRTVAEAFDATPRPLVRSIVFNAHVEAKDKATGKATRPCLVSVNATRDAFEDLVLDEPELDPVMCLRHLHALVSPHPYDLEPVRPVLEFDLSKYKFVEEIDIASGLDGRANLLDLSPTDFEHLIQDLFTAIGMKAWVTRGSRDDGVDAVAINEDPIVGGKCVIQAKRYSNVVGVESIRALAGTMVDESATKGILVTTSWVGKTSRDFAVRNGRIEIIEGRELKSLLLEHLDKDVRIGLPKVPKGWERRDTA